MAVDGWLTVAEVCERLDIGRARVHQLIRAGRLPATKFGPVYMIREADLDLVKDRKPGRPFKKPRA